MAEKEATTVYVVFRGESEQGPWTYQRLVEVAQRARVVQAIQEAIGGNPAPGLAGWWLAVKADSYRPRHVNIETRPVVTFDLNPEEEPDAADEQVLSGMLG